MNQAGEGIALQLEKTFDKFKEKVMFIMKQYEKEQFSFDEYSFEALEFIVCRYYGYLVRVKREEQRYLGKNLTPKFPQMGNSYPPNLKNQKSEILESKMNFPPK